MNDVRALALSVLMPGFTGTSAPSWLRHRVDEGLGSVCLFGHNVEDPAQIRALTDELHTIRPGLLVASDEEGGSVTRLDVGAGSRWPGHAVLGALDDLQATYDVASGLGAQARAAGVDIVLAPVLDVNSEPDNPVIGVRAFGATTELVARHGTTFVRGIQDTGAHACAKHYPGHGATRTDSHVELPVVDVDVDTWRRRDLAPFAAAVRAGVRCVMTAHVVVPAVDDRPATMSPPLLRLLREEIGFDGVVLSDAVDMKAISAGAGRGPGAARALAAGVDLVCIGNPAFPEGYDEESAVEDVVEAVEKAVADGTLPLARLEEASRRVGALRLERTEVPADRETQLAVGSGVAARALTVRGDVRLPEDTVVVVPAPRVGYAAGRVRSALVDELRRRRPEWPVRDLDDPAAARQATTGADRVVLVVEGRPDPAQADLVGAVLGAATDAVVVYGGLPRPDQDGANTVHAHGTGAATARAVADRLLGEEK